MLLLQKALQSRHVVLTFSCNGGHIGSGSSMHPVVYIFFSRRILSFCNELLRSHAWSFEVNVWVVVVSLRFDTGTLKPIKIGFFDGHFDFSFRMGGMFVATFILLCLTTGQWYGTICPLQYKAVVTTRKVFGAIFLCWAIPLPAIFIRFLIFAGEGLRSPNCENDAFLETPSFRIFLAVFFFFPGVLMTCMYSHILVIVCRHVRTGHVRKLIAHLLWLLS